MNLREFCYMVDKGGIGTAEGMAQTLEENGYQAGEFVSNSKEEAAKLTQEQTTRWFLGQFISITRNEAWFAMNSWINSIDRFVPEDAVLAKINREQFDPKLFEL